MADEAAVVAAVRAAIREAVWTAEDALGPVVDVSTAVAAASTAWASEVRTRVLPLLASVYRDAWPPEIPGVDAAWALHEAGVLARLSRWPAALGRALASAQDGPATGRVAAAADALAAVADDEWRAERIGRSETTAALGAAVHDSALAWAARTDENPQLRWVAHEDERTRDTHATADGQVRTVGTPFTVGAARLRFPGDPTGPAGEVVNCRCRVSVVGGALTASTPEAPMPDALPTTTPGAGEVTHQGVPDGWRGPMAPLGAMSGDGRLIAARTPVRVRPLPLPLMEQIENASGHAGGAQVGRIDRVWVEDGLLWGEGPIDGAGERGAAFAQRLADGFAGHVSVDLDDVTMEEVFVRDGHRIDPPRDFDEWLDMMTDPTVEVVYAATDWRLMGVTAVNKPAFADARVEGVWGYQRQALGDDVEEVGDQPALIASVPGEVVFQAEAFADPKLRQPTPVTITDDGRVYGHLATWGTCHVGYGNACVTPPKSRKDYAYFHVGAVATDRGDLPVGKITLGGGHADPKAGAQPALAHYDESGTAVAVIRAGEDSHGIWVAGSLLPHVTPAQVAELRRSPLSGDWRAVGGNLELIAALAVNTPGFPIPRTVAASAGQEQVSLVASGVVAPERPERLTREALVREVLAEVKQAQAADARAEELARRVGLDMDSRVAALAARVGIEGGD